LLMLTSALVFTVMSACTSALADRCDWRFTVFARSGLAFAFTAALAWRGAVRLIFRWPRTLWVRSVVGSGSMLFTFYALAHLPIATAVTLFNTFPLWVTLLAWPVLGMRPTAGVALALLSAVLGVALIEQPHAGDIRPASLAALFAAVCTAVVMLGLHRLRNINSLAIVVHFSGVATLTCLAYVAVTAVAKPLDFAPLAEPTNLALLLGIGLFASLGQIAMTKAFSFGPPQKLAIVGLSQVVFALLFDLGIWGRTPDAWTLAGIILVMAPVAWVMGHGPKA
jgi:drug/metabolite transporter (DMT)-like permease